MTSSLHTEIDWDGFTKSGMEKTGCNGGCFDGSSWRVVGEKGATMSLDTARRTLCNLPLQSLKKHELPGCEGDQEVLLYCSLLVW